MTHRQTDTHTDRHTHTGEFIGPKSAKAGDQQWDFWNKVINLEDGKGIVKAIQKLIPKKLVNVYKFEGLQLTVNSPNELIEARTKIGKYFTFDEIL